MRSKVVRALRPLDAVAVENPAYPGTPDVNFVGGWMELKWIRHWPKNAETPVRIEHFTRQQRVWLTRRRHAGGAAWLMLQCRREWLLFDGAVAARVIGQLPRGELTQHTRRYWPRGLNAEELISELANATGLPSIR